jgi:integrase/recombinase XerD
MRPKSRAGKKAVPKPLPIEVNEKEYTDLLIAAKQKHHKIAFLLAWESGLRISEVIGLRPEDFDFDNRTIRVNMGKNSKDRIVPMSKIFGKEHLQFIPIKCGVRAIQKAFLMYSKKTGLRNKKPKVHYHSLRHGFATHCLRKGISLPSIQGNLGHEDLQTTAIYLNLAPEERIKEYQELF